MKHISYRIDKHWFKNHRVVDGWFVLGQKNNDYNWELLYEASSLQDAIKFIAGIKVNQRVYGPDGYGIDI